MAQIEKYYCRGCGAVLPVKANAGRIKCEYCGTVHLPNTEQKKDSSDLACPNCGFRNPLEAQYCGDCGKALFHTCPKCGTQNRMDNVFCAKCGADIEKIISKEGPYKHVSIDDLYTDYLQEGKKLYGEYFRSTVPFSILGGLLVGGGFIVWVFNVSGAFVLGNWAQYGLVISGLSFVFILIADGITKKQVKLKALRISKYKPGFDKFFKTILRQPQQLGQPQQRGQWASVINWPETLPDERKRKEFLFLIGKK